MTGFQVPSYLDYLATLTWATSGAIVGLRKGYDLTGVFMVALLASMGGGLIRDGLFLQRLPVAVTDPVYLPVILVAVMLVALSARWLLRPANQRAADYVVKAIDSVGTPAFAVVGMQLALRAGIPLPGVLLIGVLNGTGGGLLRDIMVNDTPALLQPGYHFATALVLVCVGYLAWTRGSVAYDPNVGWSVVVAFVLIRATTLYFGLRTKAVLVSPGEGI